jgi:hypothetical protein
MNLPGKLLNLNFLFSIKRKECWFSKGKTFTVVSLLPRTALGGDGHAILVV